MAYTAYVLPTHRLGVLRLFGGVDGPDLLGGAAALYHAPAWRPSYSAVWDFREVERLLLLPEDVERVLGLLALLRDRMAPPGRAAILATRELDEVIARLLLYRHQREGNREGRVFACCHGHAAEATAEAASWLGVPARVLAPPRRAAARARPAPPAAVG